LTLADFGLMLFNPLVMPDNTPGTPWAQGGKTTIWD
jgi:hypothetical protein